MLQQTHTPLRSLSVLLATQNQAGKWEEEEQFSFLELITEPFRQLRNIPIVTLENIYYCRDPLRMNVTQYILDKLSPAIDTAATMTKAGPEAKSIENAGPVFSSTDFWLSNSYHCNAGNLHPPPPLLQMTKILTANAKFKTWKAELESVVATNNDVKVTQQCEAARRAFAAFRQVYSNVDSYYFSRLPKGRDWLLHQARVARERGDLKAIHECGQKLEKLVDGFVEEDRVHWDRKKTGLKRAVAGFYRGDWGGEGEIGGGWLNIVREEEEAANLDLNDEERDEEMNEG
jgi:hypothetical protein